MILYRTSVGKIQEGRFIFLADDCFPDIFKSRKLSYVRIQGDYGTILDIYAYQITTYLVNILLATGRKILLEPK